MTDGFKTLEYRDGHLRLLDQTRLPGETRTIECWTVAEVVEAITSLRVRGAPAIGCAGAYGAVVAAERLAEEDLGGDDFRARLRTDLGLVRDARPTAVNLPWAIARMTRVVDAMPEAPVEAVIQAMRREADAIEAEDDRANRRLGRYGAEIVPSGARILTHCNAGALATASFGTAVGVIRSAHDEGKTIHVWVDETRPLLQGARLTAWELQQLHIPYTLIADGMAGHFMARGEVDIVITGADRIAANGDVANKIGTYSLAVLAAAHGIPFYVAAPTSTVDLMTPSGSGIPIEQRDPREVTEVLGTRIAPEGATAANPAFDITPARYVAGIITEHGISRAPYEESLRAAVARNGRDVEQPDAAPAGLGRD